MNTLKTVIATSLGLATGAAIGLLTAPRSGKKTRKMITDEVNTQVNKIESEVEKKTAELKHAYNSGVKEYTKSGKEFLDRTKETVSLN